MFAKFNCGQTIDYLNISRESSDKIKEIMYNMSMDKYYQMEQCKTAYTIAVPILRLGIIFVYLAIFNSF